MMGLTILHGVDDFQWLFLKIPRYFHISNYFEPEHVFGPRHPPPRSGGGDHADDHQDDDDNKSHCSLAEAD